MSFSASTSELVRIRQAELMQEADLARLSRCWSHRPGARRLKVRPIATLGRLSPSRYRSGEVK